MDSTQCVSLGNAMPCQYYQSPVHRRQPVYHGDARRPPGSHRDDQGVHRGPRSLAHWETAPGRTTLHLPRDVVWALPNHYQTGLPTDSTDALISMAGITRRTGRSSGIGPSAMLLAGYVARMPIVGVLMPEFVSAVCSSTFFEAELPHAPRRRRITSATRRNISRMTSIRHTPPLICSVRFASL